MTYTILTHAAAVSFGAMIAFVVMALMAAASDRRRA
jgi:hypothetical protein